jgi:hypothetical protein
MEQIRIKACMRNARARPLTLTWADRLLLGKQALPLARLLIQSRSRWCCRRAMLADDHGGRTVRGLGHLTWQ